MKKTIYEGEAGVLWREGKIQKVLASGRHRYSLWRNEKITTVNVQAQEYLCQVQDYATKDNLTVRFLVRLRAKVGGVAVFQRTLPEAAQELFVQNHKYSRFFSPFRKLFFYSTRIYNNLVKIYN